MNEQFRRFHRAKSRKGETKKHFIIKSIVYKLLVDKGHLPQMEFNLGDGVGAIDVFDTTDGMAYEVESNPNKATAQKKLEQYTKNIVVKDVIIINANMIKGSDLLEWIERIEPYLAI